MLEDWKELSLTHFYERCNTLPAPKNKNTEDHFRRQVSEYYYTHCIEDVLEHLQHTRADKVRECRQEALEISKSENKPLGQVLPFWQILRMTSGSIRQLDSNEVKAT